MKWIGLALLLLAVLWLFFGKSPVPPNITIKQRDSVVGVGKVLILTNRSNDHYYNVHMKIRNAQSGTSTSYRVDDHMRPGESTEVGWMQLGNWKVEQGELITISTDGNPVPVTYVVRGP